MSSVANLCSCKAVTLPAHCPICNDSQVTYTKEGYMAHLAECIHGFSLLALPTAKPAIASEPGVGPMEAVKRTVIDWRAKTSTSSDRQNFELNTEDEESIFALKRYRSESVVPSARLDSEFSTQIRAGQGSPTTSDCSVESQDYFQLASVDSDDSSEGHYTRWRIETESLLSQRARTSIRLLRREPNGSYKFIKFSEALSPAYATLSHRWLDGGSEVSFPDMESGKAKNKVESYAKIRFCGEQAAKDGLEYFWIDTCCIDRRNSLEVQEAVLSMFEWYRKATKCYVYLADLSATEEDLGASRVPQPWESPIRQSIWFSRGWTLQELLAPACVEFFSKQGTKLGNKQTLQELIGETTGISRQALQGEPLSSFSIEERFSWAEKRETSRPEDKWYSLLGIFEVSMRLDYGEGDRRAYQRLRDKVQRKHVEQARLDDLWKMLPTSSAAAFNSKENQYGPTCLANTWVDILRHIEDWASKSDSRSIYWLNGGEGTCKSTIARTIARKLHGDGNLGGSFFFSRGGEASEAVKLITTLASQMAISIPSIRPHICYSMAEHKDLAAYTFRNQWNELITKPLSFLDTEARPPTIVVVVDALDECSSPRDIRMFLTMLATTDMLRDLGLRILITSRPDLNIRAGFGIIPEEQQEGSVLNQTESEVIDRYLELLFKQSFQMAKEQYGFESSWPGEAVVRSLVESSHGSFIWASTACKLIGKGKFAADSRVNKLLNSRRTNTGTSRATERLDEIYMIVLREYIPSPNKDSEQDYENPEDTDDDKEGRNECLTNFRKIVGTIAVLSSPLSLDSLAGLLSIDREIVSKTLADLDTILHIPDESNQPIRLYHPSFRDFLLDKSRCNEDELWIDEMVAQKKLAESCVRLMSELLEQNICRLEYPGQLASAVGSSQVERYIPLELQYACVYWAEHFRRSRTHLQDNDNTHRFFKKHFLHWLEAMNLTSRSSEVTAIVRMYQSLLVVSVSGLV